MEKKLMGKLKIEVFRVFSLFGTLSFKCQTFCMHFLQKIVAGSELDKEAGSQSDTQYEQGNKNNGIHE